MNKKDLIEYVGVLQDMYLDGTLEVYFKYQKEEINDHPKFDKFEQRLSKIGMMERGKAFKSRSKKPSRQAGPKKD